MKTTGTIAMFVVLIAAGSAQAAVVSDRVTATIAGTHTIDTKGYFGPAGASLAGKTIALFYQYNAPAFGPSQSCGNSRTCFYNVSKGNAATQGSVVITVEIDRHRVVYTPADQGTVYFNKGTHFFIESDVFNGSGLGLPGAQLLIDYTGKVAFGSQLSPINEPLSNPPSDEVEFFDGSSQAAVETLTFTNVVRVQ